MLAELSAADPGIHRVRRGTGGNVSTASNTALGLARGEWVVLMDRDDLLPDTALYRVAAEIRHHPEAAVIYSDEDHVDEFGNRSEPYFKADFDPDLLLAQNLISHLGAYRRDLLERIGGFRLGFEGSQGHDPAASSFSESQIDRCVDASRRATAAAEAKGEVLLLLNNDIDVIEPGWLREMVSQAMRPEIGAVGATLLFSDGTVQHAGILLGIGWPDGTAGHYYPGAHRRDPGPSGQLAIVRSVSAVTRACLAVRRALYEEVGGLDEEALQVAFSDVDFCQRLRAHGDRNLWTPFALLYHKESASRGMDADGAKAERSRRERAVPRERWGAWIDNDPCWYPNPSLRTGWRDLAEPPRGPRW